MVVIKLRFYDVFHCHTAPWLNSFHINEIKSSKVRSKSIWVSSNFYLNWFLLRLHQHCFFGDLRFERKWFYWGLASMRSLTNHINGWLAIIRNSKITVLCCQHSFQRLSLHLSETIEFMLRHSFILVRWVRSLKYGI